MRSNVWDNKAHSKFVRELLTDRGLSNKEAGKILKVTEGYFNNKLQRDSFSFDDILTIIYACGYSLALVDSKDKIHKIDTNYFPNVSAKVSDYRKEVVEEKRREYEDLKAKACDLEKRYGF